MPRFIHCLLMIAALGTAICAHAAEKYPSRPVRMVVPYPPGGGSDITGRAIGAKLNEALGQTFVIDNRPGATGLIGTEIAARAPADGYTLLLADAPHTINALVYAMTTLNREISRALNAADVKERFTVQTFDPTPGTPADFLRLLESEDKRWRDVQKQVNVRLD